MPFSKLTASASMGSPCISVAEGPSLPAGRGSHAAGIVAGHVVVAGGTAWNEDGTRKSFLNDVLTFKAGAWQTGPALPASLAESAYASNGSSLYLAGGICAPDSPTDTVCQLTLRNDQLVIQNLPPLPQAISGCSGAIAGSEFFVACGAAGSAATNELWSLDIGASDPEWRRCAPLSAAPRTHSALVAAGGQIYLLGGLRAGDGTIEQRTLNDLYCYDPSLNQWTFLANLPMGGYCWSAAALDFNHLLVSGRADGEIHDEIWLVELPSGTAHLSGRCVIQTTCAPLVAVNGHRWWLIGGEPDGLRHRTNRVSEISIQPALDTRDRTADINNP